MASRHDGIPWAGLACGPVAWAVSTQLNYALASTGRGDFPIVPLVAIVLALIAAIGGVLSWRTYRRSSEPLGSQANGVPHAFLSGAGVLSSILFAAVIVLQGLAGVIVR